VRAVLSCRSKADELESDPHYQQGKGIGAFMLFDAIDRVTRIASEVGGIGLVVNARPPAAEFYKRYGFEQMADHPLNLFLSI